MPRVIITVPEKNAQPYRFQLERTTVSLGRGSDNDIVIDSGSVSGKHAEMHRVEGGYELEDLGSTNGIKHSGARHHRLSLKSGMGVKLGDVQFDFTLSEEELEIIAREMPSGEPPISKEPEIESPAKLPDIEPKAEKKPRREPAPEQEPQSAVGSIWMVLLFLLLAAAAFITGLSIRHKKETGESLIKGIVNKGDVVEKEAPAATPPADKPAE
jgi:predicted component of type VI protein secretion system